MKDKIEVLIKEPGLKPQIKTIDNTLAELQRIVGGYIECKQVLEDVVVIMDEEGRIKGKEKNALGLVGTLVFAGIDGPEFTDCPEGFINVWR